MLPALVGGRGWLPSLLYVVWMIGWALARLAILRLAAHTQPRRLIEAAWGPALLPYLLAVAAPLDLLALGVSAALTYRGLRAIGLDRDLARRSVAWAFGGQAAVEIVSWVARSWFFIALG